MNILITGINGFVGSNFTEKWKEHHVLYGLDINQAPKNGVRTLYNWEQLTEIPETDAIVHLAGKAHDTKNESEAAEYFAVNTGLTQKIFDYFLESNAQKFIFLSRELLTLLGQKVKHKKLTFVRYEKTKNTL